MAATAEQTHGGWRANLRLGFRRVPGKTVLSERLREGPLSVQRAFYPEGDLCHVYLLHPPGGVAGGDSLTISAELRANTSALITTPGATKFYRSIGTPAYQRQTLKVSDGTLEWLPQENIFFPGAQAELSTSVELEGDASFIGWEINCLGRPVNHEPFDHGRALFKFSLYRDGIPVLHERLVIEEENDRLSAAGLRGHPVFGTLYATTDNTALLDTIREAIPEQYRHQFGISLVDGLLIARYMGDSTETVRRLFTTVWKILRPAILSRAPCEPRIWNT